MASLLGWLGKRAKGVEAQLNPFDNGLNYNDVLNNRPSQATLNQQALQRAPQNVQQAYQAAENAKRAVALPSFNTAAKAPKFFNDNLIQPVANTLKVPFAAGSAAGAVTTSKVIDSLNGKAPLPVSVQNYVDKSKSALSSDYNKSMLPSIVQPANKAANFFNPTTQVANRMTEKKLDEVTKQVKTNFSNLPATQTPYRNFGDQLAAGAKQEKDANSQKLFGYNSDAPLSTKLKIAGANTALTGLNAAQFAVGGGTAKAAEQGAIKTLGLDLAKAGGINTAATGLSDVANGDFNAKNLPAAFVKGVALQAPFALAGLSGKTQPINDAGSLNLSLGKTKQPQSPTPVKLRPNEAATLSDLQDVLTGGIKDARVINDTIKNARSVQQRTGIDVTTGTPADIQQRINTVLEQPQNNRRFFKPLNDVGAIGRDVRPSLSDAEAALSKSQTELAKSQQTKAALLPPADLSSSNGSLPNLNTKEYIKQQVKAQKEAAGKVTSPMAGFRNEFATKALDALSPIEKPVEKAIGGREKNFKLRNALDRSLRSDTIAAQFAKDNGFHEIVNSVKNTDAFNQYLTAKHAADLEANGIKTGRNLAADQQLVKQLSPQYEAQAQALGKYNQGLLDKTVEYGLISPETAAYLKQKYPNYVPFDRIFGKDELQGNRGNGAGPANLSTQTVIQRIKGSERQIQPPLESVLAKTHDVVAQGERNIAAKTIADTASLPGNPLQLKELKGNISGKSTISFYENGVKRTFETTPEVAQAAKSLNRQQLGLLGKILSYPTRALRLGATGLNIGFTAANVVKDAATGAINSRHPIQTLANPKTFLDALTSAVHHGGKNYSELVREGVGGTSFDISRNSAPDTIKRIRAERNVGTRVLYTVRHPSELLRAAEDTIGRSEEYGRAAQYYGNKRAMLKKGASIEDAIAYAADAARNNTTNFARAGEWGRVLNSVLPYFNAGIQGSRTLMRNLRDRPVQTGAKVAISAFMPVAVTTAWNLESPERKAAYDDISEYEKQGNIIIVPPNPKKDANGRWNVIKIPVSQEIANANNVIRNGVENLHGDKNFDFAAMFGDLVGTTTSLNAGSPRQLLGQITPQAIKPGVESLVNQNLFTGNPIVPDNKKLLDPKDQYGDGTSGTAKVLGRNLNLSPYHIDNFVRTAFGGLGQNVVNATDSGLAKLGVIPQSEVKGKSIEQSITNRFTSAAGKSPYSAIDERTKQLTDQLKASPEYQGLSNTDKAKALEKLNRDVVAATKTQVDMKNGTGQFAADFTGKKTRLTTKQKALIGDTADLSSYLSSDASGLDINKSLDKQYADTLKKYGSMSKEDKSKTFNSQNDAEYQYNLAKYQNDKLNGTLTTAEDIRQRDALAKDKVGAGFTKNIRELYSLNKTQLNDLLSSDPNGEELAKQLQAYDQALYNDGRISKPKFRYGISGSGGVGKKGKKPSRAGFVTAKRTRVPKVTAFKVGRSGRKLSVAHIPKPKAIKTPAVKVARTA